MTIFSRRSCIALFLSVAFPALPQVGDSRTAFTTQYCVTCHNDRIRTGGLTLQSADLKNIAGATEIWEKAIRKIRVGAMPPQGAARPPQAELDRFAAYLETSLNTAALAKPNPGRATVHRLNRAEYANAIRDLLGLQIDATGLLPPDDESSGFDNIADVLRISPSLMERYLSASWNVSRLAVGNARTTPTTATYRVARDYTPQLLEIARLSGADGSVVGTTLVCNGGRGADVVGCGGLGGSRHC